MDATRTQTQPRSRLRRMAPGLIALGLLSVGAFGSQAVAQAVVPAPEETAAAECQNLSVAWTDGITQDAAGQVTLDKVTVTGAGQGCVGRTLRVQLQAGSKVLGAGHAPVVRANSPLVVSLDSPVDVAALDSVTVIAG